MITETIVWRDSQLVKPASRETVLLCGTDEDGCDFSWPGYWEDQAWYWAHGGQVSESVTHWAELPAGANPERPSVSGVLLELQAADVGCAARGCYWTGSMDDPIHVDLKAFTPEQVRRIADHMEADAR